VHRKTRENEMTKRGTQDLATAIVDVIYSFENITVGDVLGALEAAKMHVALTELGIVGQDDEEETAYYFDGTRTVN
jgi:hypothetical protein